MWNRLLLLSSPKRKITSQQQTSQRSIVHLQALGQKQSGLWGRVVKEISVQKKFQLDSTKTSSRKAPQQLLHPVVLAATCPGREKWHYHQVPFCIGISTSLFFQWSSLLFQLTPLLTLSGLKPDTTYDVRNACSHTSKGPGPYSPECQFRTALPVNLGKFVCLRPFSFKGMSVFGNQCFEAIDNWSAHSYS